MIASDQTTRSPGRIRRFLVRWLRFALAVLALVTLAAYAGRAAWWLELTTHLRLQYALASVLLCAAAALLRRGRATLVGGVLVVANGLAVAPFALPVQRSMEAATSRPTLRLLIANVHTRNRQHALLCDRIATERPDLVLLMETDWAWIDALAETLAAYPHRVLKPREDNFGIALYSRLPLREATVRTFGKATVPSIEAIVTLGGAPVHVFLTHPLPPVRAANAALRDDQLEAIAHAVAAVRASGTRTVLAGDLNTTAFSPAFDALLATSGLRDSGCGHGLQTTWPSSLPGLLRIGIDHCLCSPDLQVVDRRVLAGIGSDHLPILVDLR